MAPVTVVTTVSVWIYHKTTTNHISLTTKPAYAGFFTSTLISQLALG